MHSGLPIYPFYPLSLDHINRAMTPFLFQFFGYGLFLSTQPQLTLPSISILYNIYVHSM